MEKQKIFILTLNDYIIYQPSILNLYDYLSSHFDVTIFSFKPKFITKTKDETRNIVYLETNYFAYHLFSKTDFILSKVFRGLKKVFPGLEYHYMYYGKYLPYLLKKAVKKRKSETDKVLVADFPALKVAQEVFGAVHFISLEIENITSPIHKQIDRSKVKSVFIQTQVRYDYLFPEQQLPTFFVQNAPVFKEEYITNYDRKGFVWAGAMDRRLAVLDCIEFFNRYPQYKLVLKGGAERKILAKINTQYGHLLAAGRIKIDRDYLPSSSFLDFLSHFKIGFCFYSWEIIAASFNYATAPSGKLFMLLAAGVPVIACDIPAFKFLEEYGAGVLIKDYDPETIFEAAQIIEANYEGYKQGCYDAARFFSFDKRVAPYVEFLLNETN